MVYLVRCVKFLQSISCGHSVIAYKPVCLCGVLPRWTCGSSINLSRSYAKNANNSKIVSNTEDVRKIRNIGIMAHIDAGKTTTTERMLYYSGFSKHLGNVDRGDTVTDYMIQERERGITIMSAAITFNWKQHRINLIDTPGHVDFTLEVERCLRVLDGAVTVLDASAGVEAQTLTVWRQADRYGVPRIIFLNKMDKTGADFYGSLNSVRDKLMTNPLPLQIPIGKEKQFSGVVDLLDMNVFTWDENDPDGSTFNVQPLDKSRSPHIFEEAMKSRAVLLESLANLDDFIGEQYVEDVDCRQLSRNDLIDAVRRLTLSGKVVPVLCGSALRNRGIQPLLDAVISFLPAPTEREHHFVDYYSGELSALAFKILHDKQKGPMTFLRLYSGSLESGGSLYNVNRGCAEKLGKLFQVNADEHREVQKVTSGNIVAVTGLKQTITGDTLVASHQVANAARDAYLRKMGINGDEEGLDSPVLAGMTIPDPVFFCSIEPPSMAFQKSLDQALECLLREDPSLRIRVDPDTSQTIIGGMGELHLEIIRDRILKEYGVDASFGPLQIAYRESVMTSGRTSVTLDKTIGNTRHSVTLCLSIHSNASTVVEGKRSGHEKFIVVPDDGSDLNEKPLRRDHVKAIESGITSGLSRGPLLGFPIVDAYVQLHDFRVGGGTSAPMISACTAQCLFQAAMKATPILLEPVMALEIYTDELRLGTVLADLSQRRSHILDIQAKDRIRIVTARTPLAELRSYASILRRITSGLASFSMELDHYEQMNDDSQKKAIQSITGF